MRINPGFLLALTPLFLSACSYMGIPNEFADPMSVDEMASGTVQQKNMQCAENCVGYKSPGVVSKSIRFGNLRTFTTLHVSLRPESISFGHRPAEYYISANVLTQQVYQRGANFWYHDGEGKYTPITSRKSNFRCNKNIGHS